MRKLGTRSAQDASMRSIDCLRCRKRRLIASAAACAAAHLSARVPAAQDALLPPEGQRVVTFDKTTLWKVDPTCSGILAVARTNETIELRADLDWRDPPRRSGVVWVEHSGSDTLSTGVFATLRCQGNGRPRESAATQPERAAEIRAGSSPATFRACTGLRDADGNVFWGRGFPIAADRSTTVGMYPEMRFPLPQGFRSERFDPARVAAVGIRLDVIDDKRRSFSGGVAIESLRIAAMPDELRAQRARIAERIGSENWLTAIEPQADPAPAAQPVPIAVFCDNSGVNYPWPVGFYAGVGRRPWKPEQAGFSTCVDQISEDFAYLARHRVRLVRVFLFCDARTGIISSGGGIAVDPFALDDLRALLAAAEKHPALRLVPVLFDFLIADGVTHEDAHAVGEHPDWITDPAKRRALFDALEPAIALLCAHPQVAFIDLMNEPEHAAGVDADAMWQFLRELAERVHRHPRRMACTIGSGNAVYAPFWRSAGIDFPTAHWFSKIDASHPLGDRSAALPPAATIMTEVDPGVGVEQALTKLWQAGFRGGLFWSLNAGDAYEFRGAPAEAFKRWVEQRMPR
jgi:hypothetical protein